MTTYRKQISCFTFSFLFLLILNCCLSALTFAEGEAAQKAQIARVDGTSGILFNGQKDYVLAQEGMVLAPGDKIMVTGDASLVIAFDDKNKNIAKVKERTSIEMTLDKDEKLKMLEGDIFCSLQKLPKGEAFEIRTPTAVSGARGTEWETRVSEDEGTVVEALRDNPYVKTIDENGVVDREEHIVLSEHSTRVNENREVAPLEKLSSEDLGRLEEVSKEAAKQAQEGLAEGQNRPEFSRQEFMKLIQEQKIEVVPLEFMARAMGGPNEPGAGPQGMSPDKMKGLSEEERKEIMKAMGEFVGKEGFRPPVDADGKPIFERGPNGEPMMPKDFQSFDPNKPFDGPRGKPFDPNDPNRPEFDPNGPHEFDPRGTQDFREPFDPNREFIDERKDFPPPPTGTFEDRDPFGNRVLERDTQGRVVRFEDKNRDNDITHIHYDEVNEFGKAKVYDHGDCAGPDCADLGLVPPPSP